MENPPPGQTSKSSTGLDENVAALLSYVFGWISGLIFFLIEKDSRLVRFHAMQSLLLSASISILMMILWFIATVLAIVFSQISGLLGSLVYLLSMLVIAVLSIGGLIAWVMCLIKAYNKEYYHLPVIGKYAEQFSAK
jgi:uncharacterized membrane protein